MNENDILQYVEPILRFCCKRLSSRYDAEDLASEIICHILEGIGKYEIESLDAWVWRIAHNRYARFIDRQNKTPDISSGDELYEIEDDYCFFDEESVEEQYESVFRALHTLSSEYRNIIVDYYIGEMSVKQLSAKYSLTETTIKWRLNVGRQKIKDRTGENEMDKIYKRINWNTRTCNGSMDSDRYLHTQFSRAICKAAYEKPLTVEEISMITGIPAMYIEDELPRLEYGDAVKKIGSKYAADFIIFSLENRQRVESAFAPIVSEIADLIEAVLEEKADDAARIGFVGCDSGMKKLGHIAVPYLLRKKISAVNKELSLSSGNFPPRKDGGYGWFIVSETENSDESISPYTSGCNASYNDDGCIYYYHLGRYFRSNVYHGGTRWLTDNRIIEKCDGGIIPAGIMNDDDAARLIEAGLISKESNTLKLDFPIFTRDQFDKFTSLFDIENERLDTMLSKLITFIHKEFVGFVPKHLASQINQWVSGFTNELISYVVYELIDRGELESPADEKPLTDGVFCVYGEYMGI